MNSKTKSSVIAIGVNNLRNLLCLNRDFKFSIPYYQRPYVWDEEKIEALFKDIKEEFKSDSPNQFYFMGTLLFHQKNGNILEIIDGQQRITTLLLLDFIVNEEDSLLVKHEEQLRLFYNSNKSRENILRNRRFMADKRDRFFTHVKLRAILENLIFTIIVTQSEDDAFIFFDTQNNRGVKLSAVDFLKSYHLKALKGEDEEIDKQKLVAKAWDKSNQNQFLDTLFHVYLCRGRTWKGKDVIYENKDKILTEFQKKTLQKPKDNSITLFANNKNRLAASIVFSAKKGINIQANDISLQTNPIDYPFSFRQPIEKGMSFFLFTEKYDSLFKYIFRNDHTEGNDLYMLKEFYASVYEASGFSHYFTDIFKLCIILYFDKFEEHRLFEFTLWLDYLLGSYRIKQKSIVAQTPVKIIRDRQQNLLDILDRAYLPDEIFEFLQLITNKEDYEALIVGRGVQQRYRECMTSYYGETEKSDLTNKQNWIYAKLQYK